MNLFYEDDKDVDEIGAENNGNDIVLKTKASSWVDSVDEAYLSYR